MRLFVTRKENCAIVGLSTFLSCETPFHPYVVQMIQMLLPTLLPTSNFPLSPAGFNGLRCASYAIIMQTPPLILCRWTPRSR